MLKLAKWTCLPILVSLAQWEQVSPDDSYFHTTPKLGANSASLAYTIIDMQIFYDSYTNKLLTRWYSEGWPVVFFPGIWEIICCCRSEGLAGC